MSSITNFFKRKNSSSNAPPISNKVPKNLPNDNSISNDPAVTAVPSTSQSTDAVRTGDGVAQPAAPPRPASTKLLTTVVKTVRKWEKELGVDIEFETDAKDDTVVTKVWCKVCKNHSKDKASSFRNQYDNDVTVWSPQGRIHQLEYAMEAVKQGSASVGLKNKTHAIILALKRAPSELSAHQKKILPIDDHVGVAIAGLTADARLLSRFMRYECLSSRYVYERALPVNRLVAMIGSKSQIPTQRYGRRPFGVGLLVAGYDEQGPHIYQTCPSANYYDCKAMAIGARSQSARTYLEKFLDKYPEESLEDLIRHGLRALRDTLPNDVDLNNKNCSLAIVGKDTPFTVYENNAIEKYLALIEGEERSHRTAAATDDAAPAMDTEEGDKPAAADPQVAGPEVEQRMDQGP